MILEELRRQLERALSSAGGPLRSDERIGREVVAAIDHCFDVLLLEAEAGRAVDEAGLAALLEWFEGAYREVPFDLVRREWLDRRYPAARMVDPVTGRRLSPTEFEEGEPVVVVRAHRWATLRARELGRRLFRLRHPDGCDCAEQRSRGRDYDEPNTTSLREVGPSTDAYYLGEEVECGVCGARWNRLHSDDDLGGTFWDLA